MSAKENCEDKKNTILAFRKLCACLSASMSNTTGGGSRVLKTNLIRSKVTQGQDFRHHQSMSVRFGNGGLERGDNQNTLYIPMMFSKNETYFKYKNYRTKDWVHTQMGCFCEHLPYSLPMGSSQISTPCVEWNLTRDTMLGVMDKVVRWLPQIDTAVVAGFLQPFCMDNHPWEEYQMFPSKRCPPQKDCDSLASLLAHICPWASPAQSPIFQIIISVMLQVMGGGIEKMPLVLVEL